MARCALVGAATLAGIYITKWIGSISWLTIGGKPLYMPEVCTAILAAMVLQRLLRVIKMDAYVDKKTITRIGSGVSDFMVGFGVASIKISVVVTFWQPLLFLVIAGVLWVVFNLLVMAPRMLNNYWFERGIFNFGWCTGVVAFGVTLLRIVDPDYESGTLEDYGLAYIIIAPIELFLVSLSPIFYATYGWWTTLVLVLAAVGIPLTAKAMGLWYPASRLGIRQNEKTMEPLAPIKLPVTP